jgi:hypothetical protein
LTKRIPYLGFGLTETHVVELEKYLIMWVKDNMGTEGHPLCRKGVVVAKAKAAAEADKPKDMAPKGRENNTNIKQSSASVESAEDSDKDKEKHRKQSSKKRNADSPILRRGHRTKAAAIVFEQMCFQTWHCKGRMGVCKGEAGLGRPIKLDEHLRPALGMNACMHVCVSLVCVPA